MSAIKFLKFSGFAKYVAKYGSFRWNQHMASAKYAQTLLNLPETKVTALDNGFRVATTKTDSPIATVGVWADAGSRYERPETNGAGNFFEHIAFKGTQQRSREALNKEISSLGAQIQSYTDREETAFYSKCLSTDASKMVDILGDSINNFKIDDELVEEQRKVILREMDIMQDDLKQVTMDYLHLTAFQGTPLSKSIFGTTENIKKFTKDDISFYARNSFVAPRMVLCVSGNINHDEMVKAAEKSFGSTPIDYTDEIPELVYCRYTGSEVRARDDLYPYAHCAVAINTCGFNHPDVYPLALAQQFVGRWDKTLLSSNETFIAMIRNIYKEPGCQSFDSFHQMYRDTGLWGIHFVMDRFILDDFMYNVHTQWNKLCINVTEEELQITKNIFRNNVMCAYDDSLHACGNTARQLLLLDKCVPLDEIEESIEAVTLKQLRDTCLKYIYDRCPVISAVGPIEGMPEYTRIRSQMYWIRY